MTSPIFVIVFSTLLRTHKIEFLFQNLKLQVFFENEVTSWLRPHCPTKAKFNDAWFLKFQHKVSFLDDLEGFLECLGLKKIEFWWNLMVVWYLYGEKKKDEPRKLHLHFASNHIFEALSSVGIYPICLCMWLSTFFSFFGGQERNTIFVTF